MELLEAWGVPVLAGKLESVDVEKAYEHVVAQRFSYAGDHSGGDQTENLHLLHDEELQEVRESILLAAKLYLNCLGHEFEDLYISNSWAVRLKPSDYVAPHHHSNCYISGVFYLTTGQPLHLQRPWTLEKMFMFSPKVPVDPENALTQDTRQFHPEPTSCIIMPSGMSHYVEPVEQSLVEDRYSIAFNILPKGKFGHSDVLNDLTEHSNE